MASAKVICNVPRQPLTPFGSVSCLIFCSARGVGKELNNVVNDHHERVNALEESDQLYTGM